MEINENVNLENLSKEELNALISQLESGMRSLIDSGDRDKVKKLNFLIGQVIDLYATKK